MTGHHIEWRIDRVGYPTITGTVVCDEPPEADCRNQCECETYLICDTDKWCPEHGTVFRHCTEGHVRTPMPGGECNICLYLNDGTEDLDDLYTGRGHALTADPISPNWEDEGYSWIYADEATS